MIISIDQNINQIKSIIEKHLSKEPNRTIFDISLDINEVNDIKKLLSVKSLIEIINKSYPHLTFNFNITYIKNRDYSINSKICKVLEDLDNYLRKEYKVQLKMRTKKELDKSFGFRDVVNANRKIDSIVNKVKNATFQGENLSPFEKLMLIYEEVTDHIYKEDESYYLLSSSHWIPVVNGDTIVCTGYASLIQEISKRVFSDKEVLILDNDVDVFDKRTDEKIDAHASNIVLIKDKKYNINGMFYLDSCWDSIEHKGEKKGYAYCCTPLFDIAQHKLFYFDFRKVYHYNLEEIYDNFFGFNKLNKFFKKLPFLKELGNDTQYFDDKSSLHYFINNYDDLPIKSVIPLEAYTQSFKIIGSLNGLTGNELKEYVKTRIDDSVSKTKFYFNHKNCISCFANIINNTMPEQGKK